RITTQVNAENGDFTMFVIPEVAVATKGSAITSGSATFTFRDPEVRSTKSVVRVKDGDTIVLGGLIRNERQETVTKLPFFGDIPLFGNLFKHTSLTPNTERELIVFITPRIVKEGSEKQNLAKAAEGAASKDLAAEVTGASAKPKK
ncbi:MAG: hypothetical protein PHG51_05590, partial [Candidatus Omnitrophica bacterium]|nr:hypothetical protein [Candidatus Omnitrophota bacterium]